VTNESIDCPIDDLLEVVKLTRCKGLGTCSVTGPCRLAISPLDALCCAPCCAWPFGLSCCAWPFGCFGLLLFGGIPSLGVGTVRRSETANGMNVFILSGPVSNTDREGW